MSPESIIDDSKPNAGRMYDYYLGGFHNFAVDRQAADQVLQFLPFTPKFVRLQRWALQDIAEELERRGYDVIIDFASGLPTNDHIHLKVSSEVTVIYSDHDPVVVEYAQDILKDAYPNVYFFQADACHPEALLNRPDVLQILNGKRKVAFVFWGVSIFISDQDVQHAIQTIYDWAAPGSCLAFNAQGVVEQGLDDPALKGVIQIYESAGAKLYFRQLKEYRELIRPWQLADDDFIPLLSWHGFDKSTLSDDVHVYGPMGGGYGAYLMK